MKAFSAIVEAIDGAQKFVTLHSRGAADEVLKTLRALISKTQSSIGLVDL